MLISILLFLAAVSIPFITLSCLWPCGCLFVWLVRHRRVKVPRYRAATTLPPIQDKIWIHPHHRTKPDWVRKPVIYLAMHLHSCRSIADAFIGVPRHASLGAMVALNDCLARCSLCYANCVHPRCMD